MDCMALLLSAINFIPVNLFLAIMIISEWKPVYLMASIVNSMFNWYEFALQVYICLEQM